MIAKVRKKWNSIPIEVKVSTSYAICSILQKCISFITLPLFTRLLTKTQYGQYTVYSSWLDILTIFLTLNLAYGSFSTAMIKYEDRRECYISSLEGIFLILTFVFICIYLPFHQFWNKIFELPTWLVFVMIMEIFACSSILIWSGKKRFEYKYKSVCAVTLATSIVGPVLAYFFVVYSEDKGYARIIGYALVTIIIGFVIAGNNIVKGKKLFEKEFWKYAFEFNLPLLAYYLSQVIFNQSDRIMISKLIDDEHAAMYGVAYNLAMILTFILNAINNSYVPWYYSKIKKNKQYENRKISSVIAMLMAVMILFVIWFAPEIIHILAGEDYSEAVYVVPPVAMSLLLLFYSQLFINVEFYYEEKKSLVYASIIAAVINIGLNYLLIPQFGFIVAGYTTLISYIFFAGTNLMAMKNVLKKKNIEDNAYNYAMLIIILVLFAILSFSGMLLYNYLLVRIIIICMGIVILFCLRKKIIDLFKQIKNK